MNLNQSEVTQYLMVQAEVSVEKKRISYHIYILNICMAIKYIIQNLRLDLTIFYLMCITTFVCEELPDLSTFLCSECVQYFVSGNIFLMLIVWVFVM